MSALTTCPDCSGKLSAQANACPHCGRSTGRSGKKMALAVVVIIVVGLLYALKTEHDENLMRTIKARQELDQRAVEGFDR